ncbi:deoxyribonuclease IV [[Clostridium] spiroforme]|nr:deoxyribonuclease IV [Thomasclavelia spiroformis]MBM6879625.1 deoxyribonuclease IV [Thomasclavelia spiroformis]MBM6930170.1 deoxyribonuclease IV [Thomasclavelia spiroformis]
MIIGSHVSMSGKDMLLGSVKEALSYGANTFMFYTGAPQNTRRKAIEEMKVEEAKALMAANNIDLKNVVVHAPYIINLANTVKLETFELAVDFLRQELERCAKIGTSILVLHPGSHVKAGEEAGLAQIIKGLNEALQDTPYQGKIALETMAGKGSELGTTFQQIRYLMDHCQYPEKLGVCLDTCHIHDAGYDLSDFDAILDEFDRVIGLQHLLVIHLNDSKNVKGAHKDRHANLGHGEIGFDILNGIAHHPRIKDVPKILETPFINGKAPYKEEIEMLKNQTFKNIE